MEKNRDDIKNIMEKAVELIHQFTNDPYVQRIKERDKTTSMMEIVGVLCYFRKKFINKQI